MKCDLDGGYDELESLLYFALTENVAEARDETLLEHGPRMNIRHNGVARGNEVGECSARV